MVARPIDPEIDEIALAIVDDVLTETPTFDYDIATAGKYERQLSQLINARKNGLMAARGVLKAIGARSNSDLAALLRQRDATQPTQSKEYSSQSLPSEAQLPENCLPRPLDDPQQDWFEHWDSSNLRSISPFLANYIGYSRQFSPEGYVDFHISSGLWALSTIAARRICVPLADAVYTPLAIALVARTSLFAKTSTAKAATNALKAAGLGWLLGDDETTPQKLLADMAGHVPTNYGDMEFEQQFRVEQRMSMSGQIGWYYDEFNQLIDAMTRPGPMAEFAGLLRKLDNCPDEYKYSTRSHGQEVIKQPYLPLLASTTPANLRKYANKGGEFWNDGFWARFAFITPPPDGWCTKTMDIGMVPVPPEISKSLKEWNERLGVPQCLIEEIRDTKGNGTGRYKVERGDLPTHQLIIHTQAYAAYKRYRESLRSMIASNGNQDLDGSYVRLSDKALRIAALIASLENDGNITLTIWTLAQEIAEMFRRNLHELYAQINIPQQDSPLEDMLIDYLKNLKGGATTIRDIVRLGPHQVRKLGSKGVNDLLKLLQKSGIVELVMEGRKECWKIAL